MPVTIEIEEARPEDAREIADLHLAAGRAVKPDLPQPLTDAEMRDWFVGTVGSPPAAWWVARSAARIVGYMVVHGEDLGHLYVLPGWQRHGIGQALLEKAKALSPRRLELYAVQHNTRARTFYENHGFRAVNDQDEPPAANEPGVQYVWRRAQ